MLSILFFLVIIYFAIFGTRTDHKKLIRRNLTRLYGKEYADEYLKRIEDFDD